MFDDCEARDVLNYFAEICKIPHGSGNEKNLSDYLLLFAERNNLYAEQDEYNNIFIKKRASLGYEDAPGIILQAHIDMVCVKEKDFECDFLDQPLELILDKDFLKAKKSSLGADDGIGVAIILAILESKEIKQPELEIIFTVDEERNMLGARNFDIKKLRHKILFNLDGEEENCLVVGSGGGIKFEIIYDCEEKLVKNDGERKNYKIVAKNFLGGHSAVEIDKERANAIIIMARILNDLVKKIDLDLIDIEGGVAENVIANNCEAIINLREKDFLLVEEIIDKWRGILDKEFGLYEKNFLIEILEIGGKCVSARNLGNVIKSIFLLPNGLINRNLELNGVAETSSNIGVIKKSGSKIKITGFARSSCESKLDFILATLDLIAQKFGGELEILNKFPAWEYNSKSRLVEFYKKNYEREYKKSPRIEATHGGLECSFFQKIDDVEIISLGPNIFDCHSINEKLDINSVNRFWRFFKKLLADIKNY